MLLANIGGSSLCMVDVAGSFGRDLSAQGEPAMVAFAIEWLTKLFGSDRRCGREEIDRDALECRAVCAGRDIGGSAGRAAVAENPDRADGQPVSSLAKPRTRRCGAPSTARGKAASAPPTRRCAKSARSGIPNPLRRRRRPRSIGTAPPRRMSPDRCGRRSIEGENLHGQRQVHRILAGAANRRSALSSAQACRRSSGSLRPRSSPRPRRSPDRSGSFRAAGSSPRSRSTSCRHRCLCLHRRRTRVTR